MGCGLLVSIWAAWSCMEREARLRDPCSEFQSPVSNSVEVIKGNINIIPKEAVSPRVIYLALQHLGEAFRYAQVHPSLQPHLLLRWASLTMLAQWKVGEWGSPGACPARPIHRHSGPHAPYVRQVESHEQLGLCVPFEDNWSISMKTCANWSFFSKQENLKRINLFPLSIKNKHTYSRN